MRPLITEAGVIPTTEAENDGRCVMSDLLPSACGLPCHRNSEPLLVPDTQL